MRFRKRPVEIEAEQFDAFGENGLAFKKTIIGIEYPVETDSNGYFIEIPTLEGVMRCNHLDWVIKGVNGEFYPCKPEIFEKTYERV